MSDLKEKLENLKKQQEQAKEIFVKCQGAIEMIESMLEENKEEKFPPINPHPKEELASIMYKAGQRSVVEWLQNRLKEDD